MTGLPCPRPALKLRLSMLLGLFAASLLAAPRVSAQVTASPALEIFSAPGATVTFTITVRSGTTLGSVAVLTMGAPNLDYVSVASGTTCPILSSGTCKVEVAFQPTAPGRRQGAVVLSEPGGNVLLSVSLDGAGNGALAAFGPGVISNFAGTEPDSDGGLATSAMLAGPTGITSDGFGNHYIADPKANKVYKVSPAGLLSTFAGTGAAGFSGDGALATSAQLNGPMSVLADGAGFLYIADTGNNVVRMVDAAGVMTTYAGQYYATGTTPPSVCAAATNSVGDGCPGNQMIMNTPVDLVFCHAQNLHISDKLNNRVRTIMRTTYQTITQVGNGTAGYNGDGELNTSAELNGPTGMVMDAANYIYVADSGNHIIRRTLLTGTVPNPISTIAGTPGTAGNTGDGAAATSATFNNPHGVQVDPAGDVYISDFDSHVIRKVNVATGLISTIAGTATAGHNGDGSAANGAQLNAPADILLDEVGNLYVADSLNAAIRKVNVADAPSLVFANTAVDATSAAQDVTVMNLGNSALTIAGISAPAGFSLAGPDTSCNFSSGQTLNLATSCVLGIEFQPTTTGNIAGSLVLTDNSNPSTQTIALSGTSAAADGGTTDAGTTADAGPHADGGTSDGGTSDGGTFDGGTSDGGTFDGGTSDGGTFDGGTSDGGTFDGGTFDGGTDAGGTDAGTGQATSTGSGCTTAGGSAALWSLLLAGLLWFRRRPTVEE